MQQVVLFVSSVSLFATTRGIMNRVDGQCACALVAHPSDPPKYAFVCYTRLQETVCTTRLVSSNELAPQLTVESAGYITFRDDSQRSWSMLLAQDTDRELLLAHLALAFFVLAGQPGSHNVATSYAPQGNGTSLGTEHEAQVRYLAYRTKQHESLLTLGELMEDCRDSSYNFAVQSSSLALHDTCRGFECSVVGMRPGDERVVVVPSTLPRSSACPTALRETVVFVVRLMSMSTKTDMNHAAQQVPVVFASEDMALTLREPSHSTWSGSPHQRKLTADVESQEVGEVPTKDLPSLTHVGIREDHMMLVEKVGAGLQSATAGARDIRDGVQHLAADWRRVTQKPDISILTHGMLAAQITQLCSNNEKAKEDLRKRDELLHGLEARNSDLQKKIDAATKKCEQLLREKTEAVATFSDTRLERERSLLKLREQILSISNERDDVHRHAGTIKKLLEACEDELQTLRGKLDDQEARKLMAARRLDAATDSLEEGRRNCAATEDKIIHLREQISAMAADVEARTLQIKELEHKMLSEKEQHSCLMEEERVRRQSETEQLREEVIREFKHKDDLFRVECARISEEQYKLGCSKGRLIGHQQGAQEVDTRVSQLRLDCKRSLADLDAAKAQLHTEMNRTLHLHNTLGASASELHGRLQVRMRQKAHVELELECVRSRAGTARNTILLRYSHVAQQLTHPTDASQLIDILNVLQQGGDPDLSFQAEAWERSKRDALTVRLSLIDATMYELFSKGAEYYYSEWLRSLQGAYAHLTATIKDMWTKRYGLGHYNLHMAELRARFYLEDEMARLFDALARFRDSQATERRDIWEAAKQSVDGMWDAYEASMHAIQAMRDGQRSEREVFACDEATARDAIVAEEWQVSEGLPECFRALRMQNCFMAQQYLMTDEASRRSTLVAEEHVGYAELLYCSEQEKRKALANTLLSGQLDDLFRAEEAARRVLVEEVDFTVGSLVEYGSACPLVLKRENNPLPLLPFAGVAVSSQEQMPPMLTNGVEGEPVDTLEPLRISPPSYAVPQISSDFVDASDGGSSAASLRLREDEIPDERFPSLREGGLRAPRLPCAPYADCEQPQLPSPPHPSDTSCQNSSKDSNERAVVDYTPHEEVTGPVLAHRATGKLFDSTDSD